MNKKELNEKYHRVNELHDESFKLLQDYVNGMLTLHGGCIGFEVKDREQCEEDGEEYYDQFPIVIDIDGRHDTFQVAVTKVWLTENNDLRIDGEEQTEWDDKWFKGLYTRGDYETYHNIAIFINAVLKQETEGQEEEEDAPTSLCMEDYEKGEALMRKDGFFSITSVHRDDLSGNGFDASAVTDAQMKELAKRMCDDYLEQMFFQSLQNIAEIMGIPKLTL